MNAKRTAEEQRIVDLTKRAIRLLNKVKKAELRLKDISFGLGVDRELDQKTPTMSTTVSMEIQCRTTKGTVRLFFYESWFDVSIPRENDGKAGLDKVSDEDDKMTLRIACSVWVNSARIRPFAL